MTSPAENSKDFLRDGIETLPEPLDMPVYRVPENRPASDADLDEKLLETFPASDAPDSGRIA